MEEKETKKEKTFYKKWWFWVIVLAIIVIISFTSIIMIGFSIVLDEVGKLAMDIQSINENVTVYSSAGENTLIIELRDWSNDNSEELSEIINVVKDRINKGGLSSYHELITLTYLESNGKEESLFIRTSYNIPEFTQNGLTKEYIDFSEYQNLFDTLDETMEGYTGLFNSLY